MAEYIDREAAIDAITNLAGKAPTRSAYDAIWKSARTLKKIPAADVVPVVHGRWIPFHSEAAGDIQYCSNCEIGYPDKTARCPHCGAIMDGGVDND